ncbi:MAG: LytR C-terminal domain-containing protein, partial [Actinobacteria bacterium]|nr:LytR C-terminal domain-containing protein [Actinomycetota bacterium]
MQAVTTRGARGAIVIALAVIVGVVLLQVVDKGNTGPVGDQSARAAARSTSTTTAPAGGASSTTATTAAAGGRPASQVTVQVLNGSGKSGVAGTLTTQLKGGGYNTLTATDTTHGTGTVIYFQPGFDREAAALATVVQGSQVAPMPSPAPQNA